jgi:hypothetical protein
MIPRTDRNKDLNLQLTGVGYTNRKFSKNQMNQMNDLQLQIQECYGMPPQLNLKSVQQPTCPTHFSPSDEEQDVDVAMHDELHEGMSRQSQEHNTRRQHKLCFQ